MITPKDLESGKVQRNVKVMFIGGSGSGKTHAAATFPKCYFLLTEPGGSDTFTTNPKLLKNIVGWDYFVPESAEDTKRVFTELVQACSRAREMAKKGDIETLVMDNGTFLSENRWIYINKHDAVYSQRGELDPRGMYGKLSRWMYQFTLMSLLSCPCNVVFTVHEMLEDDEAMAKKPDKSTPIIGNILGGFRDKVDGMFSYVMYLVKKGQEGGTYKYYARTNKGQGKNAKSRIVLPSVIENFSYNTLVEAINKQLQGGK